VCCDIHGRSAHLAIVDAGLVDGEERGKAIRMTTVVTGASGHVGANLVRTLLERGDKVRAVFRSHDGPPASLRGLDVETVHADVRDEDAVTRALAGAELVFHLAAVISISGDRGGVVSETNIRGVRNVARAARAAGARRLVHTSSIHAFFIADRSQAIRESSPRAARPESGAYDLSKAGGEAELRAVIAEGLDAVVVNPTGIVGPNDFGPSRMGRVVLQLATRTLPSLIDGGFDFVDVRDVVAALIAASEKGRTGENYLAGGHWHSFAEIAAMVERATGAAPPALTTPTWLVKLGLPFVTAYGALTGQEPLYTGESLAAAAACQKIDCSKAAAELGHAPRPLEETVRDTCAWFESAGMLSPRRQAGAA
jgi:dihydroflavonol-4-reductase